MSLKTILNYRKDCIICGTELSLLHAGSLTSMEIEEDKETLFISNKSIDLELNKSTNKFYSKVKNKNVIVEGLSLTIHKECLKCDERTNLKELDIRLMNSTTLSNINCFRCAYYFKINLSQNKYNSQLIHETIKYKDKNKFYHINTNHSENKTQLCSGSLNETLDRVAENNLMVAWNTSNIKTLDQLFNKFQLYTTLL